MQDLFVIALIVCALVLVVLVLALRNQRKRNRSIRKRFRDLECEEQRMFSFLHDLGLAIENEPSPSVLSRIIVDGIDKVVNARGERFTSSPPATVFSFPLTSRKIVRP